MKNFLQVNRASTGAKKNFNFNFKHLFVLLAVLITCINTAWGTDRTYTVQNPETKKRYVSGNVYVTGHTKGDATIRNTSSQKVFRIISPSSGNYAPFFAMSKAKNIKAIEFYGCRAANSASPVDCFTLQTSDDAITYGTPSSSAFTVTIDNNGTLSYPTSVENLQMIGKKQTYSTKITVEFVNPVMGVTLVPVNEAYIEKVVITYDDAISPMPQLCEVHTTSTTTVASTGCTPTIENMADGDATYTDASSNTYYYTKSSGWYMKIDLGEGKAFATGDEIWIELASVSNSTKKYNFCLNDEKSDSDTIPVATTGRVCNGMMSLAHYVTKSTDPWVGSRYMFVKRGGWSSSSTRFYQITIHRDEDDCTPITPTWSTDYSSTVLTAGGSNSSTPTVGKDGSSGAVSFAVTSASPSGSVTVNSSTGVVTPVKVGTATITATVAANGDYCSGTVTKNFTIKGTITYNANGDGAGNATGTTGSVPTDANLYASGASITVAGKSTLAKTNCAFAGWNTAANGTGTWYDPGASISMGESNITLYAQWAPCISTADFDGRYGAGKTDAEKTSSDLWSTFNILNVISSSGDTRYDEDEGFEGLKLKNAGDWIGFGVASGSAVEIATKTVNASSSEVTIDFSSATDLSGNADNEYASASGNRFFRIKSTANKAVVLNQITITPSCTAPTSVSISSPLGSTGWAYIKGETIQMHANVSGGSGTPHYTWQKKIDSEFEDIDGAPDDDDYEIANCTASNSGTYRCIVSTGDGCSTTSSEFDVKVYRVQILLSAATTDYDFTTIDRTEGYVQCDILLQENTDYAFKILEGHVGLGNNSATGLTVDNCTNWGMWSDNANHVGLKTNYTDNYRFTWKFASASNNNTVSVTYPTHNQTADKTIYFDNSKTNWSNIYYRIGNAGHNENSDMVSKNDVTKVAGTANFYQLTTWAYNNFLAWHFADNTSWSGDHSIYKTDGSGYVINNHTAWQKYVVSETITLSPTTNDSGTPKVWSVDKTTGMKTYTVTSSATNCTITLEKCTNYGSGTYTALSSGGTVMPTQYVKVTVTPSTGYEWNTFSISGTEGTDYDVVTAAAAGTPGVYIIMGDVTFTASCSVSTYDITYHDGKGMSFSGSHADGHPTTHTYGTATNLKTATKSGYVFAGWYDNNSFTGDPITSLAADGYTDDIDLYAKWEKDVYLNLNGKWSTDSRYFAVYCWNNSSSENTWVWMELAEVCSGIYKATIPSNYYDRVIFVHKNSNTLATWDNKEHQSVDLTFPGSYDQYTLSSADGGADSKAEGSWASDYAAPTYTITFAANGGSGSMSSISSIACDEDRAITANSFTKTGYSFAGWKANVNVKVNDETVTAGSIIANSATIQNVRSNITLTAQWTIDTHTVTYNANGGSGTTADGSSPYDYGSTVTTISNSFTNSGYKFKWWNTAANGSGEDFYVGEKFNIAADANLYAQWESVASDEAFWVGDNFTFSDNVMSVGDMRVKKYNVDLNQDITQDYNQVNKQNGHAKKAKVMAMDANDEYIEIYFSDGSPIKKLYLGATSDKTTDQNIVVVYSATSDFTTAGGAAHEFKQVGENTNLVTIPGHDQTTKSVTDVSPSKDNLYTHARIYRRIGDANSVFDNTSNLGTENKLRIYSIKAKKGTIMRTITGAVSPAGYGTVSPSSISVEDGSEIDIDDDELTCDGKTLTATPTSDGVYYTYSFSSWSGTGVSDGATVSGDLTATANFTRTAVNYSLAWDKNGSGDALSGTYDSGTTAYGTSIAKPNDPTWSGYTFSKWNSATNGSGNDYSGTMPAENTTYYAQWTANKYDVSLTLTDSKATKESGTTGEDAATHGSDYTLTFAAVSGYKLSNDVTVYIGDSKASKGTEYTWSVSAGVGTLTIGGDYILDDITITVTAVEDVTTYSVTYADGGASSGSVPTDASDYSSGDEVTVLGKNTLVKTGYAFVGWSDGTTLFLEGQKFNITSDKTLTAVWDGVGETKYYYGQVKIVADTLQKNLSSPSICFFTNTAGVIASSTAISFESNPSESGIYYYSNDLSDAGLSTSSRWNSSSSDGRYVRGLKFANETNYTLHLGTNIATSIKFYGWCGGSSKTMTVGGQSFTSNSTSKTFETNNFTKSGGFTGDVTISQNGDFYGILVISVGIAATGKTVTFDKGSGPSTVADMPDDIEGITSGLKILQPDDPSAEGYEFEGWVTTSGGSTPFDFANTTITSNTTIYASWSECPERATITSPTTPQSIKLYTDRSKTLTVEATPYSSGTLQYQWKKDGVNIVGATSASHTVYGSIDGTVGESYVYTCEVTQTSPDACIAVTSPAFTITFASTDCGNNVIIEAVRTSGASTEASHAGVLYGSSSINTENGGKLGGKGQHFGLTLKSGYYFQNGDKLYVKLNTKNGNGDGIVVTAGLDGSGTVVGTLDNDSQSTDYNNEITLSNVPTNTSSIVIYRTTSVTQNPYIDAMKVKRYTCPGIFIFDDAAENGEWSDDDNWIGLAGHGSGLPTSDDRVLINESITVDTEDAAAAEVNLASEKTMTVEKSVTMGDVIVETGATLNVAKDGDDGIELALNSLSLKGGWNSDKTNYDMPRVYINPDSKITREVSTINFDISVDNRNYYPIALPFDVPLNSVDYAESYIAGVSEYGTHYEIDEYDGERRAEHGGGNNNWKRMEAGSTLKAGTGYILSGLTVGGKAIIRFPMNVDDAWLAGGEKGTATVSAVSTTKNKILVTAYVKEKGTTPLANKGWNLIGVPFMSCYTTSAGMYDEENVDKPATLIAGRFDYKTGKWTEKDANFYVTVPTHDFTEFKQSPISEAVLMPGWCFFVQVEETGNLIFLDAQQATSNSSIYEAPRREQLMPTIKTGIILSGNEASDKTTFLISDKYSAAEYEINADLEKMFGENGYTLATYSLSGDTRLAYNAMSRTDATNVIPIGYRAPAEGEYTFAINPRYAENGDFERIDLIDYETGFVTNLLQSSYTFTSDRTQSDSRFALNVVPQKETPTDVEPVTGDGLSVTGARKVIINDKLYIILNGKMYDAKGVMVK